SMHSHRFQYVVRGAIRGRGAGGQTRDRLRHYGCGGVRNAMSRKDLGLINKWLRHIKDVYHRHTDELESIPDTKRRWDRLVEWNVIEQLNNLAQTSIVQKSWKSAKRPHLHGWVYDLHTGYLRDLAMLTPESRLDDIYMFDLD